MSEKGYYTQVIKFSENYRNLIIVCTVPTVVNKHYRWHVSNQEITLRKHAS